jgi:hypothetical protein
MRRIFICDPPGKSLMIRKINKDRFSWSDIFAYTYGYVAFNIAITFYRFIPTLDADFPPACSKTPKTITDEFLCPFIIYYSAALF